MGGLTRNKFLWVSLAAALVAAVSILVTLKDVGEIPEWVEGFIVSTAVQQSQHFGPNDEDHLRKVCWVLTAGALFFIALLVFAWNEFRSHSRCRVALEEERRRASQVDSTHTDFLRQLDKEAERIRSKLDLFKSYRSIISDCTDLTILEDGTCDVTYTRRMRAIDKPVYMIYWQTGAEEAVERFSDIKLSVRPEARIGVLPVRNEECEKAIFAFLLPGLMPGEELEYTIQHQWAKAFAPLAKSPDHRDSYELGVLHNIPTAEFVFRVADKIPPLKLTHVGEATDPIITMGSQGGYRVYKCIFTSLREKQNIKLLFEKKA